MNAARLTLADNESPDGESLLPILRGDGSLKREAIFFHFPNYAWHRSNRLGSAVRARDYKLIERFDDGSVELFNLKNDLSERHNLADAQPERVASLKKQLVDFRRRTNAAMPVPVER